MTITRKHRIQDNEMRSIKILNILPEGIKFSSYYIPHFIATIIEITAFDSTSSMSDVLNSEQKRFGVIPQGTSINGEN